MDFTGKGIWGEFDRPQAIIDADISRRIGAGEGMGGLAVIYGTDATERVSRGEQPDAQIHSEPGALRGDIPFSKEGEGK